MLHNANLYINHNSHASALKIVRKIVCLFAFINEDPNFTLSIR